MNVSLETSDDYATGKHFIATGPLELSNMTEVTDAIFGKRKEGQRQGQQWQTLLHRSVREYYDYIKELPIENMTLKVPLGGSRSDNKYLR